MTDISREYGAAIFALACEENAKAEYRKALIEVAQILNGQPEYLTMLASPSISLRERLESVAEAFAAFVPENVLSYIQLMCEKGRISYFCESADVFCELYDASERIYCVKVTSAVELTDEQKDKLVKKLASVYGGTVTAEYSVDPTIIGGIVVETDGNILDGSLRTRLQDVKEVINK